jgi:serine/threonine protein kinase
LFACTTEGAAEPAFPEVGDLPDALPTFVYGQVVGPAKRFLLLDKLGEGGMGEVWLASDRELSSEAKPELVALKFLSHAIRESPLALASLRAEVLRTQKLTHPNIVRIYDLHTHRGMPFIKMEYVEGNSLKHWLEQAPDGVMPWRMAAQLTHQLAGALRYAHESAGIIHRDIKPGNLLLAKDTVVKLSDFGIATVHRDAEESGAVGLAVGTLWYASPQQIAGGRPTPADDVYSVGATLYELLTGSVPFEADSKEELFHKIRHESPAPIPHRLSHSDRSNEVPGKLLMLVQRCLEKDPLLRPKAHEILGYLAQMVDPWMPTREPVGGSQLWIEPPARRKLPYFRWALNSLLLGLIATAWWQDWKGWRTNLVNEVANAWNHSQRAGAGTRPRLDPSEKPVPARLPPEETAVPGGKEPVTNSLSGGFVLHLPKARGDQAQFPVRCQAYDQRGRCVWTGTIGPLDRRVGAALAPGEYTLSLQNGPAASGWSARLPLAVVAQQTNEVEFAFKYDDLTVLSDPPGAEVSWPTGAAPSEIRTQDRTGFKARFRTGEIQFRAADRGYASFTTNYLFNPAPNEQGSNVLRLSLRRLAVPRAGAGWTNSLGMVFVWTGDGLWSSVYETRVADFRRFASLDIYTPTGGMYSVTANGWKQVGRSWADPGFDQTESHPVIGVNYEDAGAFCRWLTETEQRGELILADQRYRLPTTNEWIRLAAGHLYPWGDETSAAAGNYSGLESTEADWPECWPVLSRHRDRYPRTAPVHAPEFGPNNLGLYHLGGNAAEWCAERVVCGGSWSDGEDGNLKFLRTGTVRAISPAERHDRIGFRVVLAEPPQLHAIGAPAR